MSGAVEGAGARRQLASTLVAGLEVLDENQTIQFTKYLRLILPVDGFAFWVRANLVQAGAVPNIAGAGTTAANARPSQSGDAVSFLARGSLHYATIANQDEKSSSSQNRVVFTSEQPIEDFNEIGPEVMYLGAWQGMRFSFSRREMFYEQALLYHYAGDAVNAEFEAQIIDDITRFSDAVVVSNSIPLWLSLRTPILPVIGLVGLGYQILPSFLVTPNLVPPYIAVHVFPESTVAIQGAPEFSPNTSRSQLVRERVRVTTYGLRNQQVLDFVDYVQQHFAISATMGIMNMPVPRDEHQTQVELMVVAQQKTIEFEVNYHQWAARNVARQLIESVIVNFGPAGL